MHTFSSDSKLQQEHAQTTYPGQFSCSDDPLAILIPRPEILAAMLARGEERVLDEVCLAVAICADGLAAASA